MSDFNLEQVWDDIFRNNEWGKYPSEDLIRFVARNFYSYENRKLIKILEVGSGTGANLWFIAREGFGCFGIEGSDVGVNRCIARLNNEVPNWEGEVVQGDFKHISFEDDFFDAVIDNEAIYCNSFEDSQAVYDEIYRVLKPKGKLYTRTFSTETTGYASGEALDYQRFIPTTGPLQDRGPARFSTAQDLEKLLGRFTLIELDCLKRGFGDSDVVSELIAIAQK
ncbi:class I SAM-dependent methyltransferase [Vibrio cortegadensis]|uniref:class I SAM-dependent methyltransferase n=1 Tax=Vibrio cortegadensis TaxID=1328770 RepID=UPI00352D3D2E